MTMKCEKCQIDSGVQANLLREAAQEIEVLRASMSRLGDYKRHTDRMLALFEGGPDQNVISGESPDMAWRLRTVADSLDRPISTILEPMDRVRDGVDPGD